MKNKVVLILLLTIFSHPAMSFEYCEDVFTSTRRVLTKLYYPGVAKALKPPIAMKLFKEMDGYIWIATNHFNGDMRKTYKTVRTILGREKFRQFRWVFFDGTVVEYNIVWEVLVDSETGQINPNYIGQDKLEEFAKLHFNGDVPRAYNKVERALRYSRELDVAEFNRLGWKMPKENIHAIGKDII